MRFMTLGAVDDLGDEAVVGEHFVWILLFTIYLFFCPFIFNPTSSLFMPAI